ncbi:hypothetical protein ACUNV4_16775 [Granulosicoccus sp. 3-233]
MMLSLVSPGAAVNCDPAAIELAEAAEDDAAGAASAQDHRHGPFNSL